MEPSVSVVVAPTGAVVAWQEADRPDRWHPSSAAAPGIRADSPANRDHPVSTVLTESLELGDVG